MAVFAASAQVDLYDPLFPDLWKAGISMDELPTDLKRAGAAFRRKSERCLGLLARGRSPSRNRQLRRSLEALNQACVAMNDWVRQRACHFLQHGKLVAVLGGDHSTSLGLLQALAQRQGQFGILQFDAHADLRKAYEGFEFSHASIMFNALKLDSVTRLVQVGIRDYCQEEARLIEALNGRVQCFYDRDLKHRQWQGESWRDLCADILQGLPRDIYVSFDIDGLDPKLCPHTGTPVPGGLEFEQACYLLEQAVFAGRRIIGFDLTEVAPGKDGADADVGSRLLYRLAGYAAYSNGLVPAAGRDSRPVPNSTITAKSR
jgi:agmatinase